jgi:hypothetical protein
MLCISQYSYSDFISPQIPHEVESFSIDYSDISKKGIVRVVGCNTCNLDLYTFDDSLVILKHGKTTSLDTLLKEYWEVKFPTISLDKKTNTIVQIRY